MYLNTPLIIVNSSNLLYPREDKEAHKLFYACRNCIHQEETENKCVYRNELMNTSR